MKRRDQRSSPPASQQPSPPHLQLRIESIAAGGEGVGRLPDGRAAFVHRTAPGETVAVNLITDRTRWARARLVRVLAPAPERRDAPCPHYDRCGGCTIEHLSYPAQLSAKAAIVRDSLARIGGVSLDAGFSSIAPSPREFRYRNRVSFTLLRLRGGRVVAGFHALHEPLRIVDLDGSCLLPEEPVARAWDALRAAWGPGAALLPAGDQLRLTVRATAVGAISLLVDGGLSRGEPEVLLERVPNLRSITLRPERGQESVWGAPGLPETWGDEAFTLSGSTFLQVNREAATQLEEHVIGVAGDVACLRVVDAYCGIGLHARRFALAGASVTGIELDPAAVGVAEHAGGPNVTYLCGRAEELMPGVLPSDLLVLNPPRAGLDPAVVAAIHTAPPRRIIYISCDPATLARDVKRLGGGFSIERVDCFDLFPQTAHVETVIVLRCDTR